MKNFKIHLNDQQKIDFIAEVYKKLSKTMSMIFVNKKKSAYDIQAKLKTLGIEAKFLIGGLEQADRD